MATALNLGFPRIGANRELKRQLEAYWRGGASGEALLATGRDLRLRHWQAQVRAGIASVPVGDFSLYDHVLDTAAMFGAVPERYHRYGGPGDLPAYFAMARGVGGASGIAPLEMTKWFDTNYHYIVPEIPQDTVFSLASPRLLEEYREARAEGIPARPVLLGPLSLLHLSRTPSGGPAPLSLLRRLLPAYQQLLAALAKEGADLVQLDEPILSGDLPPEVAGEFPPAYAALAEAAGGAGILLASYFESLGEQLALIPKLPIKALHLDLVRAPQDLGDLLRLGIPESLRLSLGVVDGRNVWRTDLRKAFDTVASAVQAIGDERVYVAPSCSLLHVPISLAGERDLDPELRSWLAFAEEKLAEVHELCLAVGDPDRAQALRRGSDDLRQARASSPRRARPEVQARLQALTAADARRESPYPKRQVRQAERLGLPLLPTTTIGSFPQTDELRRLRAEHRRGALSPEAYEEGVRAEIAKVVRLQEEIGLDVLVHGEAERNDMVEYFGEQLDGFAVTHQGWVQSYGSRCVKPPIIYGDVARPQAMTVGWLSYAQSLTDRPVKGMLTGPVTILQWSFARDDQPRRETCRQIALALRDEVQDLEAAGLKAIQIDEPAFREGLPLRQSEREDYLLWAVECFRLATSGVGDATQIHSHMCYSEFNDIIAAIARMDADVITIETARSDMELLDAFEDVAYPNAIGPGVYDIHAPNVPATDQIVAAMRKAAARIPAERLWVNPDCGLKTRRWEEALPALANMVAAAKVLRAG